MAAHLKETSTFQRNFKHCSLPDDLDSNGGNDNDDNDDNDDDSDYDNEDNDGDDDKDNEDNDVDVDETGSEKQQQGCRGSHGWWAQQGE